MKKSFYRGHEIINVGESWLYKDNNKPVKDDKNRDCYVCGNPDTKEGHDPCLGTLPGVSNACCGHGINDGYIQFENGVTVRGKFRISQKDISFDKP